MSGYMTERRASKEVTDWLTPGQSETHTADVHIGTWSDQGINNLDWSFMHATPATSMCVYVCVCVYMLCMRVYDVCVMCVYVCIMCMLITIGIVSDKGLSRMDEIGDHSETPVEQYKQDQSRA